MKKQYILILAIISPLLACGGGKKQKLDTVVETKKLIVERDSLQRSKVVYNAVEDIEFNVADKKTTEGKGSTNFKQLNLTEPEQLEREINLDDFYTKVSYVTLKHPFAEHGLAYLGDTDIAIYYPQGMSSMGGFNSEVFMTENSIVAGDKYTGFHVYNNAGEYLYSPVLADEAIKYNKSTNQISYDRGDLKSEMRDFSVWGNKALISIMEDTIPRTYVYDIERQVAIHSFKKSYFNCILDDNTFLTPTNGDEYCLLTLSYDEGKKTFDLNFFKNYNPQNTKGGRRSGPESTQIADVNGVCTVRQAYNEPYTE